METIQELVFVLVSKASEPSAGSERKARMRHPPRSILAAAILSALALGGCGGSGVAAGTTKRKHDSKASTAATEVKLISFKSPAIEHVIPARYTCDGENVPPPLEWGPVPPRTRELAVFVLGLTPSSGNTATISVEWAMTGISPMLHGLAAGTIPRGAHARLTSSNSTRYSICPARGHASHYEFLLYTVPNSVAAIPRRFSGLQLVTALGSSKGSPASGGGEFRAIYRRR
jgi:phosphatidylethanolamine-binding protein (PEBP) family uncharacterized protein